MHIIIYFIFRLKLQESLQFELIGECCSNDILKKNRIKLKRIEAVCAKGEFF